MLLRIKMAAKKTGIYAEIGDYHKNLNTSWAYYPIFKAKNKLVTKHILKQLPKKSKILDAGCGEGVTVRALRKAGYDARGLDLNYKSRYVIKGAMEKIPFPKNSFDAIICLDSLQYSTFDKQKIIVKELKRVLKKKGILIFSLPNLSHFANRVYFLFTGKLKRTDDKTYPYGDRPIKEYIDMINPGFRILKVKGIFPTNFLLSSLLIKNFPKYFRWLFYLMNLFAYSPWCYYNIIVCRKR